MLPGVVTSHAVTSDHWVTATDHRVTLVARRLRWPATRSGSRGVTRTRLAYDRELLSRTTGARKTAVAIGTPAGRPSASSTLPAAAGTIKDSRFGIHDMKVFISWSGDTSHKVASVLHDWLPYVIQVIKPFMSSGEIQKGERWGDVIAKELEDAQFGIICLTPYNLKAPWLSFEAGALSKSIGRSFLTPFLFQVKPEQMEGPLAQFQTTVFEKEDVFNLLTSINNRLDVNMQLELALLRHTFEIWWPQLHESLDAIQRTHEPESATGYGWLYHPSDLSSIQLNTPCKSIWVVVRSMRCAFETTCDRKVVEQNIDRKIEYRFIFSRSEPSETHAARDSLWRSFEERHAEKEICEIHPDEFKKLAVMDFLILNAKVDNDENPLRVLFELPVIGRHHWIEVEKEAAYGFVERFDAICG